jgi:hypothetical protein
MELRQKRTWQKSNNGVNSKQASLPMKPKMETVPVFRTGVQKCGLSVLRTVSAIANTIRS